MPQMSKVELYAAIRRDYRGGMAMRHHISVSYLHRIFQGEDITVSSWIREQRLAHARRDLAGPTLRSTPIHEIASRWGFPRAADFSQAFRNACGIPPKNYRHHATALDELTSDGLPTGGTREWTHRPLRRQG